LDRPEDERRVFEPRGEFSPRGSQREIGVSRRRRLSPLLRLLLHSAAVGLRLAAHVAAARLARLTLALALVRLLHGLKDLME
jgi:hypothetical protein